MRWSSTDKGPRHLPRHHRLPFAHGDGLGVNESGQAITAEVRIGDFIDADDITIYRQLAGGVTTPTSSPWLANPIGGQNQAIVGQMGSDRARR
ncbi:MAG: hypothetical protein R3B96_11050 [Pirellulaceae bacterium]